MRYKHVWPSVEQPQNFVVTPEDMGPNLYSDAEEIRAAKEFRTCKEEVAKSIMEGSRVPPQKPNCRVGAVKIRYETLVDRCTENDIAALRELLMLHFPGGWRRKESLRDCVTTYYA